MVISFTKANLPYGWLGNMSPFSIQWEGKVWNTAEALFQAMRFDDEVLREQIREQKSPMQAKFFAKANAHLMAFEQMSDRDLANMDVILRLKIAQHPDLKEQLLATGDSIIVEDIGKRAFKAGNHKFWGASFQDDKWVGQNQLGKMWMIIRDSLKE